jgi:hypothetical protein
MHPATPEDPWLPAGLTYEDVYDRQFGNGPYQGLVPRKG